MYVLMVWGEIEPRPQMRPNPLAFFDKRLPHNRKGIEERARLINQPKLSIYDTAKENIVD